MRLPSSQLCFFSWLSRLNFGTSFSIANLAMSKQECANKTSNNLIYITHSSENYTFKFVFLTCLSGLEVPGVKALNPLDIILCNTDSFFRID